jgi:hypothetical protein
MQDITSIIQRRAKGAFSGASIAAIVGIYSYYKNSSLQIAIIVLAFVTFLSCLAILNKLNERQPRAWYRTFNKLFYLYLSRLVIIMSFFDFILNFKRFLNPLEGLGQNTTSKADDLIEMGSDVIVGGIAAKQLRPAKIVEEYYSTLDLRNKTSLHL